VIHYLGRGWGPEFEGQRRRRKAGGIGEVDGGGSRPCVREREEEEADVGFKYELIAPIWLVMPALLLPRSSSLPVMPHLPLAHHETSKCDFSHEQDKGSRTTEMSRIWIQSSPCQWLITIKPMNWLFGFSISPMMSPLTTKSTKFKVWIQDPMKHNWKTKRLKSSRMSSRRRKPAKASK
jgi:hypothetical protein